MSKMLSIADVANRLGVSYWTVRRWLLADKLLHGVQIGPGGIWRVEDTELERFINTRPIKKEKPPAPAEEAPPDTPPAREAYTGRGILGKEEDNGDR